jgi:hypothetical protein
MDYRKNNDISTLQFLELVGLPPRAAFFQQLSSMDGCFLRPPNKAGSPASLSLDS